MQPDLILIALIMTVVFIIFLYPVALKIGLTDRPCHRKQHKVPTPLIGGLASYLAIVFTLGIDNSVFPHQFDYILASTLLVCVGLIDDYKVLGVKVRLATQVIAALIMTESAGLKITELGDLFSFGTIYLEDDLATLFTVFAVVGGVNAFNMIDGIDGLAGSLTLVSMLAFACIAWIFQDIQLFNFSCIASAVLIGFLFFNLRFLGRTSAKIFLGDTGSTLFGFTVCWLGIYSSQGEQSLISPTLVLWILAIPLLDSVCIMCRRIQKGRSPFAADREHVHHILLLAGYSINAVLIRIVLAALSISVLGITIELTSSFSDQLLFLFFIGLFVTYYWSMTHAWTMMKIARYLRNQHPSNERSGDRRQGDRRKHTIEVAVERRALVNRREIADRRYVPSQAQIQQVEKRHLNRNLKTRKI